MGYYSSYTLTVNVFETGEQVDGELFQKVAESIRYFPSSLNSVDDDGVFDDINESSAHGYSKWCDMEECLEEASVEYPDLVLTLDVEGEEQGDICRIFAHKGRSKNWAPEVTDLPAYDDFNWSTV